MVPYGFTSPCQRGYRGHRAATPPTIATGAAHVLEDVIHLTGTNSSEATGIHPA